MLNLNKYDIITKLVPVFQYYNLDVYLVGGAVRDILLGITPADFDFAVELDEYNHKLVVEKIAEQLSVSYDYNDHYHTAKFIIDNSQIDFIMCRKEIYKEPGGRPEVFSSNLAEDLRRRDYSINSIAISLGQDNYGKVIDPLSGIKDLRDKKLRILHDKSYFDDPTRIFRGIKYASRLNFNFDKTTDELILKSLNLDCLLELKCGRIRQEMDELLNEKTSLKSIEYLQEYRIFSYLLKEEVNLKSYKNQYDFNKLSLQSKYDLAFYNNTSCILAKISNLLKLPLIWPSNVLKYKELEELAFKSDKDIYYFLLKNNKSLNDEVLQFLFLSDLRVMKYLKMRNKLNINISDIGKLEAANRNEFIINEKVNMLLNL